MADFSVRDNRYSRQSRRKFYYLLVIIVLIALGLGAFSSLSSTDKKTNTSVTNGAKSTASRQVLINIDLANNKPKSGTFTYIVNQGDQLRFTITTDTKGIIDVPSSPPQKIIVTSSPVEFSLTASSKGDFGLTYEPPGQGQAKTANLIGTIRVK